MDTAVIDIIDGESLESGDVFRLHGADYRVLKIDDNGYQIVIKAEPLSFNDDYQLLELDPSEKVELLGYV
jgi:hypothetical protein